MHDRALHQVQADLILLQYLTLQPTSTIMPKIQDVSRQDMSAKGIEPPSSDPHAANLNGDTAKAGDIAGLAKRHW